jgi:hypothetical protein
MSNSIFKLPNASNIVYDHICVILMEFVRGIVEIGKEIIQLVCTPATKCYGDIIEENNQFLVDVLNFTEKLDIQCDEIEGLATERDKESDTDKKGQILSEIQKMCNGQLSDCDELVKDSTGLLGKIKSFIEKYVEHESELQKTKKSPVSGYILIVVFLVHCILLPLVFYALITGSPNVNIFTALLVVVDILLLLGTWIGTEKIGKEKIEKLQVMRKELEKHRHFLVDVRKKLGGIGGSQRKMLKKQKKGDGDETVVESIVAEFFSMKQKNSELRLMMENAIGITGDKFEQYEEYELVEETELENTEIKIQSDTSKKE